MAPGSSSQPLAPASPRVPQRPPRHAKGNPSSHLQILFCTAAFWPSLGSRHIHTCGIIRPRENRCIKGLHSLRQLSKEFSGPRNPGQEWDMGCGWAHTFGSLASYSSGEGHNHRRTGIKPSKVQGPGSRGPRGSLPYSTTKSIYTLCLHNAYVYLT